MTQFFYCEKCAKLVGDMVARLDFSGGSRGLAQFTTPRIFGGYLGSTWRGGEVFELEEACREISDCVCHQVDICVMSDYRGPVIITIDPIEKDIRTVFVGEAIKAAEPGYSDLRSQSTY